MLRFPLVLLSPLIALVSSCDREAPIHEPGPDPLPIAEEEGVGPPSQELQPMAVDHLPFASRVPNDVSLFVSIPDPDHMVDGFLGALEAIGLVHMESLEVGEGDQPRIDETPESLADSQFGKDFKRHLGSNAFLYVGGEAAQQAHVLTLAYQAANAELTGQQVSSLLSYLAGTETEPDWEEFGEQFSETLLVSMFEAAEKDGRLLLPSVVIGWSPEPEALQNTLDSIAMAGQFLFEQEGSSAEPLEFTAHGATFSGWRLGDLQALGDEMRETIEENRRSALDGLKDLPLSMNQIENLTGAIADFEWVLAYGQVDEHVLLYLGNGTDGLRLANDEADSLAMTETLQWEDPAAGKTVLGGCYLSEAMVGATLPLADDSMAWKAAGLALDEPIDDVRTMRSVFDSIAGQERRLAIRDCSAWSALLIEDQGLRLETRGGRMKPGLDYESPLTLKGREFSEPIFLRAHWVQNREYQDLEWQQLEALGLVAEMIYEESRQKWPDAWEHQTHWKVRRAMNRVRDLNRIYRDRFETGIGDEFALAVDLHGVIPTWITERTEGSPSIPRVVLGRTIDRRAGIDSAGRALHTLLKVHGSEWTSSSMEKIPSPVAIEGDLLTTWHYPIHEDQSELIPGVSLNDDIWILGSSQQLAHELAQPFNSPDAPVNGMLLSMDFQELWSWLGSLTDAFGDTAEALASDHIPGLEQQDLKEDQRSALELMGQTITRLEKLEYHHRMENGSLRTSVLIGSRPRPEKLDKD